MVLGIAPAVRVTALPVGIAAVDNAASGSVLVIEAVVVAEGLIRKELAVTN